MILQFQILYDFTISNIYGLISNIWIFQDNIVFYFFQDNIEKKNKYHGEGILNNKKKYCRQYDLI